jgi:L-histidine N-alpha-methyltransferase
MKAQPKIAIDVHFDPDASLDTMRRDIRQGLSSRPRTLPSKYFYDERGSQLFERITELPEYYPTRAEREVLETRAPDIARIAHPREVVELGSGSAKKTRVLLEAALDQGRLERYVPLDVSREIAEESARELIDDYPGLHVHAVIGDFEHHLDEIPEGEDRLIALLGGTVGNFERPDAIRLLGEIARRMGPTDHFLLGTDLIKNPAVLEAAYDDARGVTAEFNKNILHVLNERLDGNFNPDDFEHVAFYNEERKRVEMHLRAIRPVDVRLGVIDLDVEIDRDETIRTEVSCKYTKDSVETMLREAGLELDGWFTDEAARYALSLSRRTDA